MILSLIEDSTNKLQELQTLKGDVSKQKEQFKKAKEFKMDCDKFEKLLDTIDVAYKVVGFMPSKAILEKINEARLLISSSIGNTGGPDVFSFKKTLNDFEGLCKEEWRIFYSRKPNQVYGVLDAIKEITPDPMVTTQISNRIRKGYYWTTEEKNLRLMASGMKEGQALLEELGVDDAVIDFLRSVSKKEVRLSDLEPKIMDWIKKEKLGAKFLITFSDDSREQVDKRFR